MAFDKNRSDSLKSKAFILLTAIVVILGIIALAVSAGITSTMLRKRDQLAGSGPNAVESLKKTDSGLTGTMSIKKAEKRPLLFNGRSRDGLVCYTSEDGTSLLPLDILLDSLKADYGILNADNAFTAEINGKKLVLGLGTGNANAGGEDVKLDTASITAENHVLVSPVILDSFEGFKFDGGEGDKTAFAYYWPSAENEKYSGVRLFKLNGKTLEISGIFDGEPMDYGPGGLAEIDEAVYAGALESLLIKSGEEYYLIGKKNYQKPVRLDIEGSWNMSTDGGFLYRVDDTGRLLLVYDIKSASLKRIRNHYSSVTLPNGFSLTDRRLFACQTGNSFVRLDFEGQGGEIYTTIARSGRIVIQGNSRYSPDRARLLLYSATDGWSMSGSDGRGIVRFKYVSSASWVDNGRVLLRTDGGYEIYELKDGSRHPVEVPFYYTGKAEDGRLFFAKGNELYQQIGGSEEKIAALPWRVDYACSANGKAPVVLVSEEAGAISAIEGETAVSLGKPGLFPNTPAPGAEDAGFNGNASFSPDGGRLALLQKGEKFLEVSLLEMDGLKQDRLTLDYPIEDLTAMPAVFIKWLENNSLMVYTGSRGWLVDFNGDDLYLHEWTDNAPIAGTFQLPR